MEKTLQRQMEDLWIEKWTERGQFSIRWCGIVVCSSHWFTYNGMCGGRNPEAFLGRASGSNGQAWKVSMTRWAAQKVGTVSTEIEQCCHQLQCILKL